jgi:hypothetical protein
MDIKETGCQGVVWINLSPDGVQWWPVMEMAVNLRVPNKDGMSLPSDLLSGFYSVPKRY